MWGRFVVPRRVGGEGEPCGDSGSALALGVLGAFGAAQEAAQRRFLGVWGLGGQGERGKGERGEATRAVWEGKFGEKSDQMMRCCHVSGRSVRSYFGEGFLPRPARFSLGSSTISCARRVVCMHF